MAFQTCTVDEAVNSFYTFEAMQNYILEEQPFEYISQLIKKFNAEHYDDDERCPDHTLHRLCEMIPMLTEDTAIKLLDISIGSLRTNLNFPI